MEGSMMMASPTEKFEARYSVSVYSPWTVVDSGSWSNTAGHYENGP